ncbi:hypothetical protein [Lysobacter gummosus]|uniref:hypothetical protein n=1 Tax=Lysobacter gummosus TaxID=262324 RepID=UPI0036393EEA
MRCTDRSRTSCALPGSPCFNVAPCKTHGARVEGPAKGRETSGPGPVLRHYVSQ